MPDSFDDFCSSWPGGRMRARGIHPPTIAIFKNVLDVYNFCIQYVYKYTKIRCIQYTDVYILFE